MALYIPEARRRRRVVLAAVVGVVLGLVLGGLVGRLSAPSVADQVKAVRSDASDTSAGLRVISLHTSNGLQDGGADLVLQRTGTELRAEFDDAPWLSTSTRSALLDQLSALQSRTDTTSKAFGDACASLAAAIDKAFAG